MNNSERIAAALTIANESGTTDGDHHKMWVIDQMVRALTDCPMIEKSALDWQGNPYTYQGYGKSDEYRAFIAEHGEWDEGVAP